MGRSSGSASDGFALKRFEYVAGGSGGGALLRIEGVRAGSGLPNRTPPALIVHDGVEIHRLPVLATPDDMALRDDEEGTNWRAAFRAPEGLVDKQGVSYALDLGGESSINLPRPVRWPAGGRFDRGLALASPGATPLGRAQEWARRQGDHSRSIDSIEQRRLSNPDERLAAKRAQRAAARAVRAEPPTATAGERRARARARRIDWSESVDVESEDRDRDDAPVPAPEPRSEAATGEPTPAPPVEAQEKGTVTRSDVKAQLAHERVERQTLSSDLDLMSARAATVEGERAEMGRLTAELQRSKVESEERRQAEARAVSELDRRLNDLQQRVGAAERHATESAQKAALLEQGAAELEGQAAERQRAARASEERAVTAEQRAAELESLLADAEQRAREGQLALATVRQEVEVELAQTTDWRESMVAEVEQLSGQLLQVLEIGDATAAPEPPGEAARRAPVPEKPGEESSGEDAPKTP